MLDKKQIQWFKDLTQIDGISGHEKAVAEYLYEAYKPYADEIFYDHLGSIMALKKSKNPKAKKLMILGHMDEIGFLVKNILDTGVLQLHPVGGWFDQVLLAQRVSVTTRSGQVYSGAILAKPPHILSLEERNKPVKISDMVVDIGAASKEEVLAMGVQIGDMIVVKGEFTMLHEGKRLLAKAFDNRYGCVLGLNLLHDLKDIDLDFDLYVGASVQEEVGLRGAQTISQMIKPDFAIILDCSPADDATNKDSLGRLGQGVLLRMMDGSMIANKELIYAFADICKAHDIKTQYYYSPGGTDAGIVHKTHHGIKTLTCCIVARNIHSCSSILDTNDYLAALKGVRTFLTDADWGDLFA